jgi:hypothetical protein
MKDGQASKISWAPLFAQRDVVEQLTDCFTCGNFLFNKDAFFHAAAGHLRIMPAKVSGNINMEWYRQYMAGALAGRIPIYDIEFPEDLDPTANITYMPESQVRDVYDMIQMVIMNAKSMKSLKVKMSLGVDLTRFRTRYTKMANIVTFLDALQSCTQLERLSITQRDYQHSPMKEQMVQAKLFGVIDDMQLKELDWNGNMLEQRKYTLHGSTSRWTLCDYMPATLRVLRIRDGMLPRMFPWTDKMGLPDCLIWVLSNESTPDLSAVYLPSSFWSMPKDEFFWYIASMNEGTFTHIGCADAFKLNKGPYESTRARPGKRLPAPVENLYQLVTNVSRDLHVDLTGGDKEEREDRLEWAVGIPITHREFYRREIIDHQGSICCTLCKLDAKGKTFKVVIMIC